MRINPSRSFVGIATEFGTPSQDGRLLWQSEQFEQWLELETCLPIRVDHSVLINSSGCIASVGRVSHFQVIEEPTYGLLCIGQVDNDERGWGTALLADMELQLAQRFLPAGWGLSLGCHVYEELTLPYECSVTRRPAFQGARVLATGPESLEVYAALTGIDLAARQVAR
jgi:hypothetical protein